MNTAACPICGRPVKPDRRYCETCDFQSRPETVAGSGRQVAANRAASGNGGSEVRIFLGIFVVAAITTTVLGMGGPLAIPALRETLGFEVAARGSSDGWAEIRWVHVASRVRAERTTASEVVGRLQPGDSVRVDFAGSGWYAVFPAGSNAKREEQAIGYVFGKLLKESPPTGRRLVSGGAGGMP